MKTFFIRHRIGAIDTAENRELYEANLIAIHYPGDGPRTHKASIPMITIRSLRM